MWLRRRIPSLQLRHALIQGKVLNLPTRAISSASEGKPAINQTSNQVSEAHEEVPHSQGRERVQGLPIGDIEEDVDRKTAWVLKAFLGATALYVGCQFFPLMGDSMMRQSVALLRVKDPLFKRMGASRLSRIAIDDERRCKIVEMGGVTELIKMLESAPDDLTRREAMKALASLSKSDIAIKALHHARAHSVINSITASATDEDILKYKSSVLDRLQKGDLDKVAQI